MLSSIEQWRKLLRQCLTRRIEANGFRKLANILSRRTSLAEASLIDVVLESRGVTNVQYEPLVPLYINTLAKQGAVKMSTVLSGLLKHSSISEQWQTTTSTTTTVTTEGARSLPSPKAQRLSTLMTDTRVIQDIMNLISTGGFSLSASDISKIFTVVAEWILAVVRWHTGNLSEDQQGGLVSSADAMSLFESLGILLVALSGTEKGLEILSSGNSEGMPKRTLSSLHTTS
jgi:mediator of RNA polymerase II transcription subunit 5